MKKILSLILLIATICLICSCVESTPSINQYTVTFKDHDGTVLKEEMVQEGHSATAPSDPLRIGYIFIGWSEDYTNVYKNTICIAQYEKDTNITFEYKVTFVDYNGTILKEDIVEEGKSATAPQNPERSGYNFIGWDKDYTNVTKDMIIVALYEKVQDVEVTKYTVTFITNCETVIESQEIEKGNKVTEPINPTKEGYTFDGWYLNNEKWSFVGYVVTSDIVLVAKWNINTYNIIYELNGGSVNNPKTYTVEDEIILNNPTKEHYEFIGWTTDTIQDPKLNVVIKNETNDKHFTAHFIPTKYTITFNENGGSEAEDIKFTIETNNIELPTPIRDGYDFIGWYENGVLATEFELRDYNLVAKWEEIKEEIDIKVYEENDQLYVNLGRYPQTVVTDASIINALSNINTENEFGYIEYNGKEYKKVVANPYAPNYTFINGNTIVEGNTYYFLVEPIKWRVLEESDGTYKLLSEMIIDNTNFYHTIDQNRTINGQKIYPNNYEYSNIRAWLNGYNGISYNVEDYTNKGFYDIAFTEEEKQLINTTLVDNSLSSTSDLNNSNICNNTNDKVYLLSRSDTLNTYYGFSSSYSEEDITRRAQVSDYARSKDCWISTYSGDYGNGDWWLRSPLYNGSSDARVVINFGVVGISYVDNACCSIRPALTITLNIDDYSKVEFKDYDGNLIKTDYVKKGENAIAPTPIREHYNFIGWDKDYTNVQNDLEVKALYEAIAYTITFNENGGSEVEDIEYTIETNNIELPTPTREGYDFIGWYEEDELIDSFEYRNYNLKAKWERKATEGLEYELSSDKTYYIVTGIGEVKDTDIIIPSVYNDLPVKCIGDRAFYVCPKLTRVYIPSSVTKIGYAAFAYCPNITSIIVDENNTVYDSRNNCNAIIETATNNLVSGCKNTTIPNDVKSIGDCAFEGCYNLTYIEIPNSVTCIGNCAFYGCSDLTNIEIPNSVTSIGASSFCGCTSLTSIEIPSSVTKIESNSFLKCPNLTSIVVNVDNTAYDSRNNCNAIIETATNNLVSGCKNTTIPNDVKSIGEYAFSDCTNLTSIEIPSSVIILHNFAFLNCSNLTSIEIPSSVTSIGWFTFSNCTSLTNINIPNSVTTIGGCSFDNCTSLTSIVIPDSVTSIAEDSFSRCTNLTIYCEATSKPEGWHSNWNSFNCPVIWGYAKKYTVTFDTDGGTQIDPITYMAEDENINLNEIKTEKEGYIFLGWFNESNIQVIEIQTSKCENIKLTAKWERKATEGLEYELSSDKTYYIVTGIGEVKDTDIIIPSVYNELPVKSIGDFSFRNSSLTSITIPSSVTCIGDSVFAFCSNLTSIVVDKNNKVYDSRNNCNAIIETATNNLVLGCKNTTIPNDVISIGDSAFRYSRLTSITIPSSVTCIGDSAFRNSRLTSITIPSSVTKIESNTFSHCLYLISIVVDKNNKVYDSRNNCNAIIETRTNNLVSGCKNTTIPNDVISIGDFAFEGCQNLTYIEIPNSVTSIGEYAFSVCPNLISIEIPNSVTSIGCDAFSDCTSLTSIEIPNSVTSIGERAFYNCTSLTNIEIGENVASIGKSAFEDCEKLTRIVIPHNVTTIGERVFYNCTSLTSIEIPNSVTSIGCDAFSGCTSLTSIEIPNSVTSIGERAFYNCTSLISIEIPNSVTSIGYFAFRGCTSLESIEIPNSVTSIGYDAFYNCTSLTIYCEATSKLEGWDSDWNYSNCPVVWGYVKE